MTTSILASRDASALRQATSTGDGAPVHGARVHTFDQIDRRDLDRVGGKAANLGELTRAGFPVPPGFVITVQAYESAFDAAHLRTRIADELVGLDVNDAAELQRRASVVRDMVSGMTLPEDLRAEILTAYRALSDERESAVVAVRSSATAEDTTKFSFAGMFESYLNVQGEADLLRSVRRCWASTFGARVLFYRMSQGMPAEMPVAVIVQRMIPATKSGVLFTVDPSTRDTSRLVIEASWGLGEVVVGGQVTPDRYVVNKSSGQVVHRDVGRKEFLLERDPATGATRRVDLADDARCTSPVLSDDELARLTALATRVEQHYGTPQDMEFAIADTELFLT